MKKFLPILIVVLLSLAAFAVWWYVTDILPEKNAGDTSGTPAPGPEDEAGEEVPAGEPGAEEGEEGAGEEVTEVAVTGDSYKFTPSTITVPAGGKIRLTFTNAASVAHDLIISDLGISTSLLGPGDSQTLEFTAPSQPGSFEFICSVAGHEDLGMRGTLVVE
ncbi:MAG: cupredoxin domain-containing protein [Patescibacteria group bacterium]